MMGVLKRLNSALLLVCWSVFCRVSFLVGVLPLGPRLCLSAMGFRDAFFPEEGRRPQNRSLSAGTPLPSSTVVCYGRRVSQYWVRDFLRSSSLCCWQLWAAGLIEFSCVGSGSCGLLFLKSMKATVFMCVAALCCREISRFSPHLTRKRCRRKDIPEVVLHSQWLQVTPIPKTGSRNLPRND